MHGFALLAVATVGIAGGIAGDALFAPAHAAPHAAPPLAAVNAPTALPTAPDAASAAAVRAGVDAWSAGDYEAAVKAWQRPAAKGDADALFNLGQAYKLGRGVPRDLAKAETYYGRAARFGHVAAADNYGIVLFQTNRQQAAMPWLQSAADRGEPRAMYVLGIAAYNGDYAPKDWVRAYALVTRAAASGLSQATASLATMNQTIPLAQRQMGVSLASELDQKAADARGREFASADLDGLGTPPPLAALPATQPTVPPATPQTAPAPIEKVYLPPSFSAPDPQQDEAVTKPARPKPATPKPAAPKPTAPKPTAPKPTAPKPASPKPAPAAPGGTWRIQLGAFGVKANADALWARVRTRPDVTGHPRQDISGTATRLLATGYSESAAQRACSALKAEGLACLVVAP